MDVPAGEQKPEIWSEYKKIIEENGEKYTAEYLDRGAFYERAAKSYAVVATASPPSSRTSFCAKAPAETGLKSAAGRPPFLLDERI